MRIFTSVAVAATAFLTSLAVSGQLSFGGHPLGIERSTGLPPAPVAVMRCVDAAALMAEDGARAQQGIKGPYRFGYNHQVDLSMTNSGVWNTMPNGDRVWRLSIHCPQAHSINFEFHEYVVPEGAQVFVYNEMDEVLGGFEAGSNPGHDQLGVDLLAGDRITIEYVEPLVVRGQGRLRVGQVTHGYRDLFGRAKGLNDSGSCNNNVNCSEGDPWRSQITSVAMIVVQGNGICTGQLINNCANDATPYFLTANHCLGGTNWVFRFNWHSPNCTPTTNGPTNQSLSGFTLLANNASSDVALLELNSTPPQSYNPYYTGWNANAAPASGGVVAIHHPSGDVKKISFEAQTVLTSSFDGAQTWRVPSWDDGTTEGGSSGSGLWNQNGLLVGQLFGGSASCTSNFNDFYGKFSVSYPLLSEWLGDCGPVLEGYSPFLISVEEDARDQTMSLSPNPSGGPIALSLPDLDEGVWDLRIMNALGSVVEQHVVASGTKRLDLDLTGHDIGVYFVEARGAGSRIVERLIIAR